MKLHVARAAICGDCDNAIMENVEKCTEHLGNSAHRRLRGRITLLGVHDGSVE